MKFYHGTTKTDAKIIIRTQVIKKGSIYSLSKKRAKERGVKIVYIKKRVRLFDLFKYYCLGFVILPVVIFLQNNYKRFMNKFLSEFHLKIAKYKTGSFAEIRTIRDTGSIKVYELKEKNDRCF